MSLIEKLYDKDSVKRIREMYLDDSESRDTLYEVLAIRIMEKDDIFLDTKPLDILTLLCMTAKFADNKEECQNVAVIIYNRMRDIDPLPYVLDDRGILLAEKTLMALSFYRSAMEYRWKYKGAPSIEFYRNYSKRMFYTHGHLGLAEHHEQWEGFLGEIFV